MRLRPTLTVYGVGGFDGGAEGEVGEDEAVDVDPLVDDFGDGLAGAITQALKLHSRLCAPHQYAVNLTFLILLLVLAFLASAFEKKGFGHRK